MSTNSLTGRCYCGEINFKIQGDFNSQCYCHCRSCQLATGAPFAAWGTVKKGFFEILRGRLDEITTAQGAIRGFCGECGTSLTYEHEQRPGEIDVCMATIDDAGGLNPQYHLWVSDMLPWIKINDDLPQYQEWRTK